jgi:hypothetical protein
MFDLGGGCNSCETIGGGNSSFNNLNGLYNQDNGSAQAANMVVNNSMNSMNNGNNGNNYQQQNNNTAQLNAQLAQLSNNGANNGNNGNNGNNNTQQVQLVAVPNNNANNTNNSNQNKAVVVATVANNTRNNGNIAVNNAAPKKPVVLNMTNLLLLGVTIMAALAVNETARYHINQAIKFNEGSPMYYLGYSVVAVLLVIVVHNYVSK